MKYPDDFNTPAFPAGKFVAVSRFMATAVMVIFFAIICVCGIILWVKKTQDISPFLVSLNPNGERWTLVEYNNHKTEIPVYYVLQESFLNKFARDWFTISDDIRVNQANWATSCSRTGPECTTSNGDVFEVCSIYCSTDDVVFDNFKDVVLPVYSALETEKAAVWTVKDIYIKPLDSMDSITETGGMWRLNIIVETDNGLASFIAYALVEYDPDQYKKTMGYYVADFNAYRIN